MSSCQSAITEKFATQPICNAAGLTERYFYESFRDREAALVAVYDELVEQMRGATLEALTKQDSSSVAVRGLTGFVGFLTADVRNAQIVLIEVVGVSPALEARRHAVLVRRQRL